MDKGAPPGGGRQSGQGAPGQMAQLSVDRIFKKNGLACMSKIGGPRHVHPLDPPLAHTGFFTWGVGGGGGGGASTNQNTNPMIGRIQKPL